MSADENMSEGQVMTPSATSISRNSSPSKHPTTPPSKFAFESPSKQQLRPPSSSTFTAPTSSPASSSYQHQHQQQQDKVPSTPSMKRVSGIFDPQSVLKTPERTPQQLLMEGTPLLSPSVPYSVPSSAKRRSTDFYSLLKSPELNRYNYTHVNPGSPDVKRRSMELNKIINKSPEKTPGSALGLSPSTGFIFHDTLLSSPKRVSPYRVSKKNDTEIKEISENLKTRLSYANLKIQHGWSSSSITELEKKLQTEKKSPSKNQESDTDNKFTEFWHLKSDKLPTVNASQSQIPQQNARLITRETKIGFDVFN
ncbi:unnamed protein product [Ambrosiozyma monospora]|uniref:Unnamed protein product n=1 Tax=Ambrosiozyma monospora TaxID=43982 RepID=A0ACB5TA30_AMBMO|nr:unnamed protein product [Ambrosiozyma monospora]